METLTDFDWLQHACAVPDNACRAAAEQRQACLTKPPGSLGQLEATAIALAAMQASPNPSAQRVWISVFAADHGVADEGVSAFPQVVTGEMVRNFASGGAAISVLAKQLDARLEVVNLGTVNDPGEIDGVRRAIIAPCSSNICNAPAMTREQLHAALRAGLDSAQAARADGAQVFIGGEMGIANTTAATALACALLGLQPDTITGAGTGLDADGIARKAQVIARALATHDNADTALEQLRCLGGFEIAALVGAFIGAAQSGITVLVDGYITTAAALAAVRINPGVRDWLLFSHASAERGHRRLLEALDATPLLQLDMRLGEASGAATAMPLLRLACALHNSMATFEQAGVSEK